MSTAIQHYSQSAGSLTQMGLLTAAPAHSQGFHKTPDQFKGLHPSGDDLPPPPFATFVDPDRHFRRSFLVLFGGIVATIALFLSLPYTQKLSELASSRIHFVNLDLSRPPPPPPIEPKPREEIKREEELKPELKIETPPLSLNQLEAALNPGFGGTQFGDFSLNLAAFAAEDLTRIFEIAEIDRVPVPIFQVTPLFPFGLKRAGVEGRVVLRFVVTPNGKVTNAYVVSSSHLEFEKPAITAVEQWRFEPGIKHGQKVSVRMEQPFDFRVVQ